MAALRQSERNFRAMADSMPQLVWTADPNGIVDYYNARADEYEGIVSHSDGTWTWQPLLHPDDLAHTVARWRDAVASGEEYVCEHRVRMAQGGFRWHLSRARLVRGQHGTPSKWFGTATDIHDLRTAEEGLQRAILARDRVVSLVSHDLRDPLGVLRTSLTLLRALPRPQPEPRHREDILSRMDRQVVKMERLLDELLDVAKLQSGRPLTLQRRSTDLVALCHELVREHGRSAPHHPIELHAPAPIVLGSWDADRLERVIGNLLSNATKYSAAGSTVVVEVDAAPAGAPEWVELRVIDRGVGIPEQDRHRVFEWFARGQNVAHTVRGTGLGLAGARQIVEAHGGTISVRSQEGAGSTFIVRLPVHPGAVERTREPTPVPGVEGPAPRERELAAVSSAEARFRSTFHDAPVGIGHVDLDGRWLAVNPVLARITGYTAEELCAKTFADITHPDDVGADWEQARRLLAGEIETCSLEKRYVRKDGSTVWVSLTASLGHEGAGGRPYFIGIVEDIEARKSTEHERERIEAALRERSRRKDEFLAILAHELRNPLAPVRTAAYALQTIEPADPVLERTRVVIDRQVTHLSRLIDDLLDVSRISRGKLQLQREPCDLAAIVAETAEDHRATLEGKGLALAVASAPAPIPVDGDPVRLAQMVGNLLHNAGRFSRKGGRVEVQAEVDPARGLAVVTVADTGVGMDAELLARLFDPFSQADQGLAREKGGLGLGLTLIRGIAELHGGDVTAKSDGPDRGTTFTLRIPLLRERQPARAP